MKCTHQRLVRTSIYLGASLEHRVAEQLLAFLRVGPRDGGLNPSNQIGARARSNPRSSSIF